jgi:hypothetical protein
LRDAGVCACEENERETMREGEQSNREVEERGERNHRDKSLREIVERTL